MNNWYIPEAAASGLKKMFDNQTEEDRMEILKFAAENEIPDIIILTEKSGKNHV